MSAKNNFIKEYENSPVIIQKWLMIEFFQQSFMEGKIKDGRFHKPFNQVLFELKRNILNIKTSKLDHCFKLCKKEDEHFVFLFRQLSDSDFLAKTKRPHNYSYEFKEVSIHWKIKRLRWLNEMYQVAGERFLLEILDSPLSNSIAWDDFEEPENCKLSYRYLT